MATWKDGAAYAPLERPDGFATPVAEPLSVAEPHRATTPGPMLHPDRFDAAPQRPLAEFTVSAEQRRDPREGFEVASLAITAAPGKSSGRDPRQPFTTTSTPSVNAPAPPTGQPLDVPLPAPTRPGPPPPTGQPSGTQWAPPTVSPRPPWAPPQAGPPSGRPPAASSQATIGWVCVGLTFAGLLLSGAAPLLLLVAGALGMRTRALTTWVGPTTLGVGLFSLLVQIGIGELGSSNALLGLLSLLCCIGFLVTLLRSGQVR